MQQFNVYKNSKTGKYIAIKKGIIWPAFFFTWIWALLKRCYLSVIVIFIAVIIFFIVNIPPLAMFFYIIVHIIMGIRGEEIQRRSLLRRNYNWISLVEAKNKNEAEKSLSTEC